MIKYILKMHDEQSMYITSIMVPKGGGSHWDMFMDSISPLVSRPKD